MLKNVLKSWLLIYTPFFLKNWRGRSPYRNTLLTKGKTGEVTESYKENNNRAEETSSGNKENKQRKNVAHRADLRSIAQTEDLNWTSLYG